MNGKYLLIVLLGAVAGLPERYGQYKPPVGSYSYREPKPAASGPEARALTPPQATPYRFSYEVDSAETGDKKSASESRDDDGVVRGQYSYVDAAGSLRTVRYMASASTGFVVVEQDLVPGFAEPPPVRSALSGAGASPVSRTALPEDGDEQEQGEAQAEREREEKKKKKEEEELRKKQEEEAKKKEEEEKRREEEQKRKEEELKKKQEEEAKRKEEEQKRKDAEQRRKEEEERKRQEEEARLMEEEAKKMEEAERKKQEEERLKKEQEESDRAHYEAEKKRQEAAAKERERLRRLFGVGQAQLVQLPQPLLVQSPTVTLLRSRPPVAAFIPPVAGVRIRGRGIDIAY